MTRGRGGAIALLTVSSAVQGGAAALAAVLATILLGATGRGLMVLGLTTASLVVVLAGLGSGAAFRAMWPGAESQPQGATGARARLAAAYTWWSLAAAVLASALAVAACLAQSSWVDRRLAHPPFLIAVAVTTLGQCALTQQTDAWFAAGLFRAGGSWGATASMAGLLGMLAAAALDPDGPRAWSLLLAHGAAIVAVGFVAGWRLRLAGLASFGVPRRGELVSLLRSGAPVLGATVGFVLAMRADRFILGAVAGPSAVGIYSLAATLSETPRLLPGALGQLVLRDVAARHGAAGDVRPGLFRDRAVALALTAAAAGGIAAAGWFGIVPIFGSEFAPARRVLLLLLVAEICLVPYGLAIRGLAGGGWMGTAGAVGILGAVTGVALFLVTIPAWGMIGAGLASLLLYALLSLASWALLFRRLGRRPL